MENQALKMTISFLEFYFFLNKTCLFLLENPLRINYEEFLFFKTFQKSVFWVRNEVGNVKHVSSIWTVLVHLVNGYYSHLNTPLGCLNVQLWCFMILQVFEQFSSAFLAFFSCNYHSKNFPIPNMHAYLEFDDSLPS